MDERGSLRLASLPIGWTLRPEAPQSILNAMPGNPALSHLPGSLLARGALWTRYGTGTEKPRRASGTMRTERFRFASLPDRMEDAPGSATIHPERDAGNPVRYGTLPARAR